MKESHYNINVARRVEEPGKVMRTSHYFDVNISGPDRAVRTIELFKELSLKFPAPDYKITVTYWAVSGKDVTSDINPPSPVFLPQHEH